MAEKSNVQPPAEKPVIGKKLELKKKMGTILSVHRVYTGCFK